MADSISHIRRIIDELMDANISHQNFAKWNDKVEQTVTLCETQIEREETLFKDFSKDYQELLDQPRIKEAIGTNQLVPIEVLQIRNSSYKCLAAMFQWKTYEEEIQAIFRKKLVVALGEARALDIQTEFLKLSKERDDKQIELMKDIISQKFRQHDEEISAFKDDMNRRFSFMQERVRTLLSGADPKAVDKLLSDEAVAKPVVTPKTVKVALDEDDD